MKDNKNLFWKIEEFTGLAAASILSIFVIGLIIDMFSFMSSPESYINPHHLDTSETYWKLRYLGKSAVSFGICLAGLMLYFLSWKNRHRNFWRYLRLAATLILFGYMVFGYYRSYLTGFDH